MGNYCPWNKTKIEAAEDNQRNTKIMLHKACRSISNANIVKYQTGKGETEVKRPIVPDEKVDWKTSWPEYKSLCINYTAPVVTSQPVWADPMKPDAKTKWNDVDGKIDRRSHHGKYDLDENLLPKNPKGRTGLSGRGLLGKWGPNHAADPIVTRWKHNDYGKRVSHKDGDVLQFVSIQRVDTSEWAIPGGMCDPGEKVSVTMKREFMEEALNSEEMTEVQKKKMKLELDNVFKNGIEIYKGYVDDPRNTDNAWMETIAYNFHDEEGTLFSNINLHAGDDAKKVKWMDISEDLKLYASHKDFIKNVAEKHKAHW